MTEKNIVKIEGTLDQVVSSRKKDGVEGKIVIKWNVKDFTKFSRLSEMQNSILRVRLEDPQLDLFDAAKTEEPELEFDGVAVEVVPENKMLTDGNGKGE